MVVACAASLLYRCQTVHTAHLNSVFCRGRIELASTLARVFRRSMLGHGSELFAIDIGRKRSASEHAEEG